MKPSPTLPCLTLVAFLFSGCAQPRQEISIASVDAVIDSRVLRLVETYERAFVIDFSFATATSTPALVCEGDDGLKVKHRYAELEPVNDALEMTLTGSVVGCVDAIDVRIDIFEAAAIDGCNDEVAALEEDRDFASIEKGDLVATKSATAVDGGVVCWEPPAWRSPIGGTVFLPLPAEDGEQYGVSFGGGDNPDRPEPIELAITLDDVVME